MKCRQLYDVAKNLDSYSYIITLIVVGSDRQSNTVRHTDASPVGVGLF